MIIVPLLSVLAAFQVRAFARPIRDALVALFVVIGLFMFHPYAPEIPYREIATFIGQSYQDDDFIVTDINHEGAATAAMAYYIMDWLLASSSQDNLLHIADPRVDATFAHPPQDLLIHSEETTEFNSQLDAVLENSKRVIYIGYNGPPLQGNIPLSDILVKNLNQTFEVVRSHRWYVPLLGNQESNDAYYYVNEYYRKKPVR